MRKFLQFIKSWLAGGDLPRETHRTYRYHLAYAILLAFSLGLLSNAPAVAVKMMNPEDWQLSSRIVLSGVGQFFILYLSGWMASRRKMPFVLIPGLLSVVCYASMLLCMNSALMFLILMGMGSLFETVTRPAITAIIRTNYPASHRGQATGSIQRWTYIIVLSTSLLTALALDHAGSFRITLVKMLIVISSMSAGVAFLLFNRIRVKERIDLPNLEAIGISSSFRHAHTILKNDGRFRHYVVGSAFYCFGALVYVSFYEKFFSGDLGFGYVRIALLVQVIPSLLAFMTTGAWGKWFDKVNTWRAWSWIRTGWGLDAVLLGLTPILGVYFGPVFWFLPFAARACRGLVQGGSWVLWWQVGVNHFAPPGTDTSRYMGILMFLNGTMRILAPIAGAWIASGSSYAAVFIVGGVLVLLSALHCAERAHKEKGQFNLSTMERFEANY